MGKIVSAYTLDGNYEYSNRTRLASGTMKGKAVRYDDGRLVGLMTDTDVSDPSFENGFVRYIWGNFHKFGLSFMKFDSLQTNQNPIYWFLKKNGEEYLGGWTPLGMSEFTLILKTAPNLQAIATLDCDSKMLAIYEKEFRKVLGEAKKLGLTGKLTIELADVEKIREELRL